MQRDISPAVSRKLAGMGVVCACLVVFIHVMVEPSAGTAEWWVYHLFKRGVCTIAVPFFFAAVGYFLAGHCRETGWWARETRKRVRTLLAPYCAWVLLALLWGTALALAANLLAGAPLSRNLPLSAEAWLRAFGLDVLDYPLVVPLWFVRCLMVFVVAAPLLVWPLRRSRALGLAWLAVLAAVCVAVTPYTAEEGTAGWFWRGTVSLAGLFYFSLGMFARYWGVAWALPRAWSWCAIAGGVVLFGLAGHWEATAEAMAARTRCVGIGLALWGTWGAFPAVAWPRWLTGLSFPIFLLHTNFVLGPLGLALNQLPGAQDWAERLPWYVGCGVTAIVVSGGVALALRRCAPRLAEVLFGGR